jgi:molybdate transport system permease protein
MPFSTLDFAPFLVSLRLAAATTLCLLLLGVPLALWLAFMRSRTKPVLESIISLPLALPPTVIGFYLLIVFGAASPVGSFLQSVFNVRIAFSFWGLLVGSVLYSMPFMVQPLQSSLESIPREYVEIARLEGATAWQTARQVLLPLAWLSLIRASALTFAHTLGEFGIVMMIGGSIAGETRTASVAVYDAVQGMEYAVAHEYAIVLLSVCFVINCVVFWRRRIEQ